MKRRDFLRTTVRAAAVGALSAVSQTRVLGANERLRVGLIGCGGRGRLVARLMREEANVDFVAVCDAYEPRRNEARDWAGNQSRAVTDFRRVLEMKDVDAVLIAT